MGKIVDASGLTYFGTKFRELLKTWTWLNNTFAKKSEMSVTDGSGADADKVTIQLKDGTSATVLKTHQDISGKVDKIPGKGLSTEDYTTEEKTKLGALPTNSELETALSGKQDVISDLETIRSGASAGATAYQKPVSGIPSTDMDSAVQTSLGKADAAAPQATTYTKTEVDNTILGITEKIPSQASSTNQLADKDFVNSSIETNTATFKGTYNLVSDLSLTTSATTAQIATAIASTVSNADNNDYVFVQIPTADATPTEIARVDRYKYNGTAWAYEWSLNNSSFTAAQWEAINSGITSGLVSKLSALPTNSELTTLLNGKVDKVEGKGLSTEDYTTAEKTKLGGIATGAQVNILEGVQVDGTDLTITNKKVNVVISGKADKVSGATNGNLAGLNASGNLVDAGIAKEDVAKKDGVYDELISSDVLAPYPLDREFTYDQTAGGADVGRKGARITGIKGKTLVWNEIFSYPNASPETGFTVTKSDNNLYTIVISENQSSAANIASFGRPFAVRHKNFIKVVSSSSNIGVRLPSSGDYYSSFAMVVSSNDLLYLRCKAGALAGTYTIRLFIVDLTLMFGAGNELTTVAEFEKFYNKPYYSYNAGALINNNATALETVGFNQWDEEWELGRYNPTTGEKEYATVTICCKNFISIFPNTQYYLKGAGESGIYAVFYYDVDKNFISSVTAVPDTITTPGNAYYMTFRNYVAYGTTYNHDICINLSSSRNGQYELYQKNTLALGLNSIACHDQNNNAVTVTGLDGVGSVYDEGVVENGMLTKIIKRFGEVDLGSLSWSYAAGGFYASLDGAILTVRSFNLICSKYLCGAGVVSSADFTNLADKTLTKNISSGNWPVGVILVKDSSYSDAATFKTAVTGSKLRYELATTVVLTLDTPIPVDYIAGYTEKKLPEDTASAVSAPMEMSVRYSSNAGPILQKIQTTFNNLLNAFKTAGKIASFTNTFDDGEGKFTVS